MQKVMLIMIIILIIKNANKNKKSVNMSTVYDTQTQIRHNQKEIFNIFSS